MTYLDPPRCSSRQLRSKISAAHSCDIPLAHACTAFPDSLFTRRCAHDRGLSFARPPLLSSPRARPCGAVRNKEALRLLSSPMPDLMVWCKLRRRTTMEFGGARDPLLRSPSEIHVALIGKSLGNLSAKAD
eukprot:scaffold234587_cov40-Tisochrysis_lutea.AAC.1